MKTSVHYTVSQIIMDIITCTTTCRACLELIDQCSLPPAVQYAADFMYNDVMSEVYMSSNTEEEKNNNYTLIVRKDNKVRGCGFDGFENCC